MKPGDVINVGGEYFEVVEMFPHGQAVCKGLTNRETKWIRPAEYKRAPFHLYWTKGRKMP